MTAGGIVDEVLARGFKYLDDGSTEEARVLVWVNQALHEIYDEADWPFLETTASGSTPLALTRARNIESVVNTTDGIELNWAPHRWILDAYGAIPATGMPKFWYATTSATDTLTVNTAPSTSKTVSVRFFQHQADLVVANTPILPARWHQIAIEGAVRRAYLDSNQFSEAAAVEQYRQQLLNVMRNTLGVGTPSPNVLEVPVAPPAPATPPMAPAKETR